MDMGFKCGLMELGMRVTGRIIRHVGKESFGMLMEMFSKENGRMIKLMVMGFMCI